MPTRILVERDGDRHRLRHTHGLVRAQRLHGPPDLCRVALVATTALLLGGDEVEVEVEVGAGARLELSEAAGTVAYHGRGSRSAWRTHIRVDAGADLVVRGEPFVLADGADVERELTLDLHDEATVVLQETLVLGRTGEVGGRLTTDTRVTRSRRPVLLEHLDLDPATRGHPGWLGDARIVDSILTFGHIVPSDLGPSATRYALVEPGGCLVRFLGRSLADSPLRALSLAETFA